MSIVKLSSQEEIDAFRAAYPEDGFTMLVGNIGIGLTGEYAVRAKATHDDPSGRIAFLKELKAIVDAR